MKTPVVGILGAALLVSATWSNAEEPTDLDFSGRTSIPKQGSDSPYLFEAVARGNGSFPFALKIFGGAKSVKVTVRTPGGREFTPTVWSKAETREILGRCADVKPEEVKPIEGMSSEPPTDPWVMPEDFDEAKCTQFEEKNLSLARGFLSEAWKRNVERKETCAYLVENDVKNDDFYVEAKFRKSSSERATTQEIYGILHRDACGSPSDEYRLIIAVEAQSAPRVSLRGKEWEGPKQSTIKPTSEGRFAPSPLILMNWLKSGCGQVISAVKWEGGAPVHIEQLQVEDFIPYRDMRLARAPISHLLSGGRGTFELIAPLRGGYGACFDFVRTRQVRNGYPEMEEKG